jgi:putative ABC transport system permease protein
LRSVFVVAEIALALVLLVGAGLLVKGFRALIDVNGRFEPESVLSLKVVLPETQYAQKAGRKVFQEQVLLHLASMPNIRSAALVTGLPYTNGGGVDLRRISIGGRAAEERGEVTNAIAETVSPSYFRLMNIGLRDGRELQDSDADGTLPVAVISRSLAARHFPGANPLERKIKVGAADGESPWMTIVGIVDDVHYSWINKEELPTVYRSFRQSPQYYTSVALRTEGDPKALISAVRSQMAAVDPNLPIFEVKPFDQVIKESIVGIAYVAVMMAVLGIVALVLAAVGIYGVMSYSVGERTHEIGVRIALGANSNDVQKLILGNGMFLTFLGIAIGLPLALGLAYGLSSLLFGVRAADPEAFLGLPVLLAGVAAVACYLPARRAMRLDPLVALRHE